MDCCSGLGRDRNAVIQARIVGLPLGRFALKVQTQQQGQGHISGVH